MKPKRGDVREDGWRFWQISNGKERWLPPDKFDKYKKTMAEACRRGQKNRPRRCLYNKNTYDKNRDQRINDAKTYYWKNKNTVVEGNRRRRRARFFEKEDGSSFKSWVSSLSKPHATFESIANLQPDPGQTLTQLIHQLSGYAMEVCEQIANPLVIEDAPPAQPTPQPDLF